MQQQQYQQQSGGRVALNNNRGAADYDRVQQQHGGALYGVEEKILKGRTQSTPVSQLFFSQHNIDALQQGLVNAVLNQTCGKTRISRQSDDELIAIMSSVYYEFGRNQPFDVVGQVRALNERVLAYAVPRIVTEANFHQKYLDDISKPREFLPPPVSTSVAGSKTVETTRFI